MLHRFGIGQETVEFKLRTAISTYSITRREIQAEFARIGVQLVLGGVKGSNRVVTLTVVKVMYLNA